MVIERGHIFLALALIGFAFLLWFQERSFHDEKVGIARVIDGDSLSLGGEQIRLLGIDAPEMRQYCTLEGAKWGCGKASAKALRQFIGGRAVKCEGDDYDKHSRLLGVCFVGDQELNRWMIEQGWAVSFGGRYSRWEAAARQAKKGIWRSEFIMPYQWRRQNWQN